MTRDEYAAMRGERDRLKEDIIAWAMVGGGHYREKVERLLTLTRVLDRAAAEYAEHKDDAQYEGREEQA